MAFLKKKYYVMPKSIDHRLSLWVHGVEVKKDIDLIGSVTAEVIERSKTFVYAIPEHTPLKTFNDIKKGSVCDQL